MKSKVERVEEFKAKLVDIVEEYQEDFHPAQVAGIFFDTALDIIFGCAKEEEVAEYRAMQIFHDLFEIRRKPNREKGLKKD